MQKFRKINSTKQLNINTTDAFVGESLEDKVRRTMDNGTPVEAISPMIYTERKDGVRPEYDIRSDRFEIAQNAMESIAKGIQTKRQERMNAATAQPNADSK